MPLSTIFWYCIEIDRDLKRLTTEPVDEYVDESSRWEIPWSGQLSNQIFRIMVMIEDRKSLSGIITAADGYEVHLHDVISQQEQ